MTENPLKDIIPARARRWLYAGYAAIVLCEGASAVGYATADVAQPDWLQVVTAITVYVGGALGLVAASNTSSDSTS